MATQLNPKLKARWVKALRSGKYKQGKGCLVSKDTDGDTDGDTVYCCLGVLCAISKVVQRKVNRWENSGLLTNISDEKVVLSAKTQITLASFNDDEGRSFNWIAKYIENRKQI